MFSNALAGSGTWINPGSSAWISTGSWTGANIANGSSANANFSTLDLKGDLTLLLNGARTIGSLTLGDVNPSHNFNLRPGTGGTLTLNNGGGAPVIQVNNGTATMSVVLAGNSGISKTGPGTLVLAGNNVYSGPTLITSGTLRLECPPSFPSNMTVMPLGDSITYGFNGSNAGYRGPLYNILNPLAPDFRYIGTSVEYSGSLPSAPIDQRHHQGHPSYTILDASNNLDGFDNTRFLALGGNERNPSGGYWLTGGNGTGRPPEFPHVITMMLGTNDVGTPSGVETRLQNIVEKITTLRPDTLLMMARITPLSGNPSGTSFYNQKVDSVFSTNKALGKNIRLVDLNTTFPANGLHTDGAHPNDVGFNFMAIQWHEAFIEAFTTTGDQSMGIPPASAVTISNGATLDLNGNQANVGTFNSHGLIHLGEDGQLTTSGLHLYSTGGIAGTGIIGGPVTNDSTSIGSPGDFLKFSGPFTNNGTIQTETSATLFFSDFINNGTISWGPDEIPEFGGSFVNNGTIRITRGADLVVSGNLVNNGLLDRITGGQVTAAAFTNNGLVLDETEVTVKSVSTSGNLVVIEVPSHTGHIYQLQTSPSMTTGSWVNEGSAQPGTSGSILTFSAARNATRGFYRIRVSP